VHINLHLLSKQTQVQSPWADMSTLDVMLLFHDPARQKHETAYHFNSTDCTTVKTTIAHGYSQIIMLLSDSKSAASVSPYHTCSVAFWALLTHKARIMSGMSKPSDARRMGQPGWGCRLPQPGQLRIRGELLGYHNNITHGNTL